MNSRQSKIRFMSSIPTALQGLSNEGNSPEKAALHSAAYYKKLSKVESFCNQIQNDLKTIKKQTSLKIKKDIQGLGLAFQTYDKNDNEWKQELQKYKEKRVSKNQEFEELKGTVSTIPLAKEPIQRMQAKNEISVPDTKIISFSDISSHVGKQILSKSRRNFGEVFFKKNSSQGELSKIRVSSLGNFNGVLPSIQSCKAAGNERRIMGKITEVKKLARQLKRPKKISKVKN